jgi:hypothetical protein
MEEAMNENEFRKEYEGKFDPVSPVKELVLIVAGNYQQAKYLADANHLPKRVWRYVERIDSLRGWVNAQVCFYGTWYRRSDALEIADYVETLKKENIIEAIELSDHP